MRRKQLRDRLIIGFLIQIILIIPILLITSALRLLDSFYNTFFVQWLWGAPIPWAGFGISILLALMLGLLIDTRRGWNMFLRLFHYLPFFPSLINFFINTVEQWKIFRKLVEERGFILAPYNNGRWYPGVVTGIAPSKHLVSVTFGDIPVPKPFFLKELEIIYTGLKFSEAVGYMLSGGFIFPDTEHLQEQTLQSYIYSHPEVLSVQTKINE